MRTAAQETHENAKASVDATWKTREEERREEKKESSSAPPPMDEAEIQAVERELTGEAAPAALSGSRGKAPTPDPDSLEAVMARLEARVHERTLEQEREEAEAAKARPSLSVVSTDADAKPARSEAWTPKPPREQVGLFELPADKSTVLSRVQLGEFLRGVGWSRASLEQLTNYDRVRPTVAELQVQVRAFESERHAGKRQVRGNLALALLRIEDTRKPKPAPVAPGFVAELDRLGYDSPMGLPCPVPVAEELSRAGVTVTMVERRVHEFSSWRQLCAAMTSRKPVKRVERPAAAADPRVQALVQGVGREMPQVRVYDDAAVP